MDSQLKKGILEMCILNCVSKCPTYGYLIIKQVVKYFPDVSESTIYAILRRLANTNFIEIFYGAESGGPERKYCRITVTGSRYLESCVNDWYKICDAVENLLNK